MQTIFYGAPGTGKSYKIDTDIISGVSDDRVFRVTFYPDFTLRHPKTGEEYYWEPNY